MIELAPKIEQTRTGALQLLRALFVFSAMGLSFADANELLKNVDYSSIPGEFEAPVTEQSIRIGTFNDVIGPTDKLLTGGASVSYGSRWDNYSIRLRLSWSLLTPIFRYDNNQTLLPEPLGEVADWQRHQLSQAFSYPLESGFIKVTWHIGNNIVGNNGLGTVQRWIHETLGDSFLLSTVDPSLELSYISNELNVTRVHEPWLDTGYSFFYGIGVADDFFFSQGNLDGGFLYEYSEKFRMFFKFSHIWIRNRGFFGRRLLETRSQWILSFKLGNYYTPSLSYSKVYLSDDRVSQYYINPVSFSFDF
ncbi:MAG: hypothetical protein AB8E15_10410 [Bdellovibrionales bacterium]